MNQKKIFSLMKHPSTYSHDVKHVTMIQTHISAVFLTGEYAYKIKKEVDFGFLDFSTLHKRKHYCEKELILNKRLCPDLYLDVVPITKTIDDSLQIDGSGPVVEYAVQMKQFYQNNMMTNLLKNKKISKHDINRIVDILVSFYKMQQSSEEIKLYGKKESIRQNIDENFEQTISMIGVTIDKKRYNHIKEINNSFFKNKDQLFNDRCQQGFVTSCHGDLHSGNIVIDDNNIYIFDCIEFNKRFRFIDIASDIGFLAMDLDIHNEPYLSSYLIDRYLKTNDDKTLLSILNFYKSYRAYVRGKVAGFQLNDSHIPHEEKQEILKKAVQYFELSEYYITLCKIAQKLHQPLMFMICGLTGTGKSTLSLKLSIDYNATVLNTDIIRKQLAGIDPYKKYHEKPNTGLYTKDQQMKTYEKMFDHAESYLKEKKNVVLDATFQKKIHRGIARSLAEKYDAHVIMILCSSPDIIVKKWLDKRVNAQSVSDGRWEIYQYQKKTFEGFNGDENGITIDVSRDDYKQRLNMFLEIQKYICKCGDL